MAPGQAIAAQTATATTMVVLHRLQDPKLRLIRTSRSDTQAR
jgi:hypothetical protein